MVCAAQQLFDQLIGGTDKKKRDSQAQPSSIFRA
jgi:hypothetical protein